MLQLTAGSVDLAGFTLALAIAIEPNADISNEIDLGQVNSRFSAGSRYRAGVKWILSS